MNNYKQELMICMSKIRAKKRQKELEIKRAARANKEVLPSFKYLLTIAYDGSDFGGYAKQKHKNTIQNKLEEALEIVYGEFVSTTESSRTDAKVHALDQKVMFEVKQNINLTKLQNELNEMLKPKIIINKIEEIHNSFHCRYDVKDKTYEYTVSKVEDPRRHNYSWQIKDKLDLEAMREAVKPLIGKHDFTSFKGAKATTSDSIRTINYIEIEENDKEIVFRFNADGFLYNMIRILVHCLVEVGLKHQDTNYMKEILDLKNKPESLESAKANGLCLMKINY